MKLTTKKLFLINSTSSNKTSSKSIQSSSPPSGEPKLECLAMFSPNFSIKSLAGLLTSTSIQQSEKSMRKESRISLINNPSTGLRWKAWRGLLFFMKDMASEFQEKMSKEEHSLIDTPTSAINKETLKNTPFWKQFPIMSESQTAISVNTVCLAFNMDIPSQIRTPLSSGKPNSEISQMALPSPLTTSLLEDRLNGEINQVLFFHFLTAWMVKAPSTAKEEYRDFCNFPMTHVMKIKTSPLKNNLDQIIFKLLVAPPQLTTSTLWGGNFAETTENL